MTVPLALATLAASMGVVALIAAWGLARKIHDELLTAGPRPKDLEIRVREVGDDRIVLEAPVPRQDIGHPGVLALRWDEGWGMVGDVLEDTGMLVTRRYQGGDGTPPVCRGPLEACPPVELDAFVHRDPGDVGLEFEEVAYLSPIGTMGAWLVPSGDGRTWAVLCHGWTVDRRELIRMLPAFHTAGMTCLVVDYRNDPGAPADPTGRYRFGISEWADLEAAAMLASDRGAERLVLGGCSTGGGIVMAFMERSGLAEKVIGLFLDAPNLRVAEVVRRSASDQAVAPILLELAMRLAELRWRCDWEATDYLSRAEDTVAVPTIVFHGTSDQTVPIAISRMLEARVPDLVTLVETPAAGHVMSWNADREGYEARLSRFLISLAEAPVEPNRSAPGPQVPRTGPRPPTNESPPRRR